MPDQLYTVEQIADRLQVHPETVRRWLRHGSLKGLKIGQNYRVSEAELQRFLGLAAVERGTS